MKYDPAIHHRHSIRLREYDYRQAGAYFITICVHNRCCIFGHIQNREMILNEYGQIAHQEWEKLPERWPYIELGVFQIMPNHMHGIIIIDTAVRAPLAGALLDAPPAGAHLNAPFDGAHLNAQFDGAHLNAPFDSAPLCGSSGDGAPARGAPTVGQIVGAYKSLVATECLKIARSKQPEIILGKLWQRNFWEHIIRDVNAFGRISQYIISNPENWKGDKFYNQP